ncbi:hypothetical protein T484DRAFT_1839682 [Baffinella frigidus]|nr:hypothetical protein T484DRAFT_1839682 [Cryptophyta sp. CCMP2293]
MSALILAIALLVVLPQQVSSMTERWFEMPTSAPFPALEGKGHWLLSAEVTQHKSFGKFVCQRCKTSWRSAHAFGGKEFQQCKACKLKLPAKWRWQTTAQGEDRPRSSSEDRSSSSEDRTDREPHQQALCSVCVRLGSPCWC